VGLLDGPLARVVNALAHAVKLALALEGHRVELGEVRLPAGGLDGLVDQLFQVGLVVRPGAAEHAQEHDGCQVHDFPHGIPPQSAGHRLKEGVYGSSVLRFRPSEIYQKTPGKGSPRTGRGGTTRVPGDKTMVAAPPRPVA